MNHTSVTVATANRITTITMNRPERRNALDDVLIRELTESFAAANRSAESRVVVLTGAGSSFCAGMDLDYLKRFIELGHNENLDDAVNLMKLLQTINTMRKPVIASVGGPAMGGGCGIAAACDFVFAGKERARFGVPEVRLGFLPALILLFLMKRMGEGRTREFVLRGETLSAAAAFDRGLATEVVADELLDEKVSAFASELASSTSQSSITLTKDLLSRLGELNEKEALEYAANLNAVARKTEDFKKGIESFINKEKLRW